MNAPGAPDGGVLSPPMIDRRTMAALAALDSPDCAALAAELNASAPGPARLSLARRFFALLADRAPRMTALALESILSSANRPAAKARMTAAALAAAPRDHTLPAIALTHLEEFCRPPVARNAAALFALIETANEMGRADLTRALGVALRGRMTPEPGSAVESVFREVRLDRMQTRLGLWRIGRLLQNDGRRAEAERARALYRERYPYHRDDSDPNSPGRALVLNLRPYLASDTIAGAHNHSNFPQSYKGLRRDAHLAIDVLLLEGLDFDAIRHQIARPDVVVNNIGNAEMLEEGGYGPLIRRIAEVFDAPLINDPDRMRATSREANWRRIGDRGAIRFPETVRIAPDTPLDDAVRAVMATPGAPMILRDLTGHMGADMRLARTEAEAKAALAALGVGGEAARGVYAIAYEDLQGADGLWRKFRVYLVDGEMVGVHAFTAAEWNVHRKAMKALDAERGADFETRSMRFGAEAEAVIPAPVWAALREALAETGLDAVGADFALLPDETALIFEINSAMRVTAGEVPALDALGRMMERAAARGRAARRSAET